MESMACSKIGKQWNIGSWFGFGNTKSLGDKMEHIGAMIKQEIN